MVGAGNTTSYTLLYICFVVANCYSYLSILSAVPLNVSNGLKFNGLIYHSDSNLSFVTHVALILIKRKQKKGLFQFRMLLASYRRRNVNNYYAT